MTRRSALGGALAAFLGAAASHAQCPADWAPIPGVFADTSNWPWPVPLGTYRGDLVVGGRFTSIGGVPHRVAARWDGGAWQPMSEGAPAGLELRWGLELGDSFYAAGGYCTPQWCDGRIFQYDGIRWHELPGTEGATRVLTVFNGQLVATTTYFTTLSGQTLQYLARWDGSQWLPLGQPPPTVTWQNGDVAVYHNELYAGTIYGEVRRWTGITWVAIAGTSGSGGYAPYIRDLEVYGDELVVGGFFSRVGPVAADCIAAWNGVSWHSLGEVHFNTGGGWHPEVLELFADGGALQIRGYLTSPFLGQAAWDGNSWSFAPTGRQGRWPLVHYRGTVASTDLGSANGGPPQSPRAALWQFPICYANCDCSDAPAVLSLSDLACFLQKFAAASSYANCDGSTAPPILNVADFTCFLQRFAAGCP